jgi:hypothetical protein
MPPRDRSRLAAHRSGEGNPQARPLAAGAVGGPKPIARDERKRTAQFVRSVGGGPHRNVRKGRAGNASPPPQARHNRKARAFDIIAATVPAISLLDRTRCEPWSRLEIACLWGHYSSTATHAQIASKVVSNILLNIGAWLVSSIVIYVSLTDTEQIVKNWGWLAFLIFATGIIFEYGRILAYKGEG